VAAFPTYLSAVHAGSDDQPTRRQLLNNLIDEEAGTPNHPELWLQFAEALGVSKEDVQYSEKQPETSNLIDTFRSVCSEGTTADGLAALYAYESQIPAVCESKIKGLVENYNMTAPRDYEYFTVHVEADREHAAAERSMLSEYVTDENAAPTSHAIDRILDALWEMLSGVCRRHAIAC
jgi:pyrroloquinoline-quinone synthase